MNYLLYIRGVRDAIEQRGRINWSTNVGDDPTGDRQESLDKGLNLGEWLARLIWR